MLQNRAKCFLAPGLKSTQITEARFLDKTKLNQGRNIKFFSINIVGELNDWRRAPHLAGHTEKPGYSGD